MMRQKQLESSRFCARFSRCISLNPNSEFGIVLVVVLVLGALGFRDRKETDVLQLICSVSLIAKRSGFSRHDDEHEDDSSNSVF